MKGIHREGFSWIFKSLLILVPLLIIAWLWPLIPAWLAWGISVLGIFWLVVLIQFFRVPIRRFDPHPDFVLAPADGKVVVVEKTRENEWLGEDCMQISIFMSPVNVHINWYPIDGKIAYSAYHPGKYLVAWHPKSSELNERSSVGMEGRQGHRILLRQVAGVLARKIKCYAEEGKQVRQQDQMGFIKFGSRVDLFLPADSEILVQPGQKTMGGVTALARLP